MIKLSGIEKIYDSPSGKIHALKGIDLNIARGEIYGIIGLSGAGKSTLVRCINMLESFRRRSRHDDFNGKRTSGGA